MKARGGDVLVAAKDGNVAGDVIGAAPRRGVYEWEDNSGLERMDELTIPVPEETKKRRGRNHLIGLHWVPSITSSSGSPTALLR